MPPFRSGYCDFNEVKRVCQSCTLVGLRTIYQAQGGRPFRFVYPSAEGTPDDLTKKPMFMGDYRLDDPGEGRSSFSAAIDELVLAGHPEFGTQ